MITDKKYPYLKAGLEQAISFVCTSHDCLSDYLGRDQTYIDQAFSLTMPYEDLELLMGFADMLSDIEEILKAHNQSDLRVTEMQKFLEEYIPQVLQDERAAGTKFDNAPYIANFARSQGYMTEQEAAEFVEKQSLKQSEEAVNYYNKMAEETAEERDR